MLVAAQRASGLKNAPMITMRMQITTQAMMRLSLTFFHHICFLILVAPLRNWFAWLSN